MVVLLFHHVGMSTGINGINSKLSNHLANHQGHKITSMKELLPMAFTEEKFIYLNQDL